MHEGVIDGPGRTSNYLAAALPLALQTRLSPHHEPMITLKEALTSSHHLQRPNFPLGQLRFALSAPFQ